jgi:uncharacterized protein (DUF4415 family)
MDDEPARLLPDEFAKAAAAQAIARDIVPIPIDRDVLEWMKSQGGSIEDHINDLLRFYMDTNVFRDRDFRETWEGRGAVLPETDLSF